MAKLNLLLFLFLIGFHHPADSEVLKNISDFKTQIKASQRSNLSLFNGLVYVGEFSAYLTQSGLESIDRKSFGVLMSTFLTPEKYDEFNEKFQHKTLLTEEELALFGFELVFDPGNFKIDLRTSEKFLNPDRISLNDLTANENEINATSAFVSGFLNYSFIKTLKKEENSKSTQSLFGSLDPNLNIGSVNLESHLLYSPQNGWVRNQTMASRDFEEQQIRVSAGDLSHSPETFQSAFQFFGLKVSKEFEMSPFQVVNSRGEREIYLETPSTVEIFINGFLVQTLSLEAGKHIIEDIPIMQGINHIIIRISDNTGKKEVITFQHTSSETMLKKGVQEYSYNAGKLANTTDTGIDYNSTNALSFFHRYGASNSWTTGVSGEYKRNFVNLGIENQLGTLRGLFIHNMAVTEASNSYTGMASRLTYHWTCPCGPLDEVKRFSLAYEYQTPHYLNNLFFENYALNDLRHTLTLTYNQKITDQLSGVLSANFSALNWQTLTKQQTSIGLNKNFKNDLFLTTFFQQTYQPKSLQKRINAMLVQLSYNFDGGKKNIVTNYNKTSINQNAQTEFTYNRNKPVDNIIFRSRLAQEDDKKLVSLSNYYSHQQFEIFGAYDYAELNKTQQFSLNPSGSLAFAGFNFSLGQRVQRSFVIVNNLQKEALIVNGDEDSHEAYLYPKQLATLTSAQPYVAKNINIISDDNNSLGLSNKGYRVMSGHKRGTLLTIGDVLTKMAEGFLVNASGAPYSYVGGKIVNLSTGFETKFFTSKTGKFYLENLKEESYQIMIFDKTSVRVFNLDLKDKLKDEKNDLGKIVIQ